MCRRSYGIERHRRQGPFTLPKRSKQDFAEATWNRSSMTSRRRIAATAASLTLVGSLAAAPALAVPAQAADAPPGSTPDTGVASMAPRVLDGDIVFHLSALEAADPNTPASPSTELTLGVMVANRDQAGVASEARAVADPTSPQYRRFLSPSQFEADFGPTPGTVSAVQAWLAGGGLRTYTHDATPGYLTATGTVAQIGALMDTRFVQFTGGSVGGLVANTVAPTVPAAVLGVAGLNTGTHPLTPHPLVASRTRVGTAAAASSLLTPQDLWDIYRQPAADEGQGQGLALFGYGTTVNDLSAGATPVTTGPPSPQPGDTSVLLDLRAFEKEYGFPQIPYYLTYFTSAPGETLADDGGYSEWTLDAQAADGMAPDASKLVDYFATEGTDPDIIGSYLQWADDPTGPLQGSTSYGNCEDVPESATLGSTGAGAVEYLGNPNQDMYAAVYADAAAMGKTLFAASGDTGQCPVTVAALNGVTLTPSQIQDYPGVDPSVVGVGGTVISFSGGNGVSGTTPATPAVRTDEDPWNYSGGGESLFIAAPPEQVAAVQPVTPAGTPYPAGTNPPIDTAITVVDHHGNPQPAGTIARIQPDVAALSGNVAGNGYTICTGTAGATGTVCDSFGAGTSLASPLWLGMWARIQAAAPANAQGQYVGLGNALPVIYRLAAPSTYLANYFDTGNEMETPPSNPSSNGSLVDDPAAGGYDALTGWGAPNVSTFIANADGNPSATPTDPTGGFASAPPASLPESPLAIGLPLVGAAAAWRVVTVRRRRRAATTD
jgi:subtilase family serine protease